MVQQDFIFLWWFTGYWSGHPRLAATYLLDSKENHYSILSLGKRQWSQIVFAIEPNMFQNNKVLESNLFVQEANNSIKVGQ